MPLLFALYLSQGIDYLGVHHDRLFRTHLLATVALNATVQVYHPDFTGLFRNGNGIHITVLDADTAPDALFPINNDLMLLDIAIWHLQPLSFFLPPSS